MTKDEAVNVLRSTWLNAGRVNGKIVFAEALNMAIRALETQPDGDTISRQAAISSITNQKGVVDKSVAKRILTQLPYAQLEIIRCKDCTHRDPEDKKCDCGHDILWQLPRQDNWFCADAKRRTDERQT